MVRYRIASLSSPVKMAHGANSDDIIFSFSEIEKQKGVIRLFLAA